MVGIRHVVGFRRPALAKLLDASGTSTIQSAATPQVSGNSIIVALTRGHGRVTIT